MKASVRSVAAAWRSRLCLASTHRIFGACAVIACIRRARMGVSKSVLHQNHIAYGNLTLSERATRSAIHGGAVAAAIKCPLCRRNMRTYLVLGNTYEHLCCDFCALVRVFFAGKLWPCAAPLEHCPVEWQSRQDVPR